MHEFFCYTSSVILLFNTAHASLTDFLKGQATYFLFSGLRIRRYFCCEIEKRSCMRIRGKKCSFFEKFGVLCFLETPVLRLALLPYYRQHIGPYGDFLSKSKRLSGMSSGRPWQIILLSGDPQRHFQAIQFALKICSTFFW